MKIKEESWASRVERWFIENPGKKVYCHGLSLIMKRNNNHMHSTLHYLKERHVLRDEIVDGVRYYYYTPNTDNRIRKIEQRSPWQRRGDIEKIVARRRKEDVVKEVFKKEEEVLGKEEVQSFNIDPVLEKTEMDLLRNDMKRLEAKLDYLIQLWS